MRLVLIFLALMITPFVGWSQVGDTPKAKPLKIDVANKKDAKGEAKKGSVLRIPSIVGNDPEINFKDSLKGRKPVKMYPDRELVQAGTGMKIDPKIGPRPKEGSREYFDDMFLGTLKTKSKFLGIQFRDFGDIDGDRVRIYLNGRLVIRNELLMGSFKGINIDLDQGFNRLEFEARNTGEIPPNTAEVKVVDGEEQVIFLNHWYLSPGSKASILIEKE